MRWRCRCVAKGAAYLCQLHFVEPAIANAAVHCPAVRLHLVSADMVMSAFVMIDEQTHTFGMALEHARVDDQYPSVRDGDAEVGKASVEHIAYAAASDTAPGDFERAVFRVPHSWRSFGVETSRYRGNGNNANKNTPG